MSAYMPVGSVVYTLRGLLDRLPSHGFADLPLKNILKRKLSIVNEMLAEAEEKQLTDPEAERWLEDLVQVLSRELECPPIETAAGAFRCKLKAESQINRTGVKNLISTTPVLIDRSKMRKSPYLQLNTDGYEDELQVFGRYDDKEAIIKLLLSDNLTDLIAIVGEGGVGKTTLAQLVYKDERAKKYFDLEAWVSVAGKFDASQLRGVFESLISHPSDTKKLYAPVDTLKEPLKMKRFLLVLDDVSCWDYYSIRRALRLPLLAGAKGSKIIITTRNSNIAATMRAVSVYHLKPLSYKDSWLLFTMHAFAGQSYHLYPKLETVGKEIVKKCTGLPSAGTILRSAHFKPTVEEWDTSGIFLPIFMLRYFSLPLPLQRCCIYCSIFPKDHEYEEEKLIRLWMAEGLLERQKNMRMEDLGHQYFLSLMSLSFFRQSSANKFCFVMHDLVNDLAQYISGDYCCRLDNHEPFRVCARTWYLLFSGSKLNTRICKVICDAKFLRTLILYKLPQEKGPCQISGEVLKDLLEALQSLRVLSLSHYNITELPDSIGRLKDLRYLDLSHTAITRLPDSATALYKLQTLILSNCRSLTELPETMGNLTNLTYLDVGGTALVDMPAQMAKITNLPKMPIFTVGKYRNSRRNKNFEAFSDLQASWGRFMEVFARDASVDNLKNMKDLDVLTLEYSYTRVGQQNETWNQGAPRLSQLQPYTIIYSVLLRNYCFSYVVFLHLRNFNNCSYLPPLGQLPYLKSLCIEMMNGVERVGPEFYGMTNSSAKPFQSLETLIFWEMLEWQEWIFPEVGGRVFPRLQNLFLHTCPKLKRGLLKCLPPSIKTVEISECAKLAVKISRSPSEDYSCLNDGNKLLLRRLDACSQLPVVEESLQLLDKNMRQRRYEKLVDTPSQLPLIEQSSQLFDNNVMELISDDKVPSQCSEYKTDVSIASESLHPASSVLSSEDSSIKCQDSSPIPSYTAEMLIVKPETDDPTERWNARDVPSSVSLKVSEISQLMELPLGLCSLKIKGCDSIKCLPEELIHNNPHLQHLYIVDCCSFESFDGGHPPIALKTLYVRNCKKLEFLSSAGTMDHSPLEHLCIGSSCESLRSFPLALFPKLRNFVIWDCANFSSISSTMDHMSLDTLEIRDCPKLLSFPKGGLSTPNLTSILLSNCKNLKELPDQLHQLKFLQSLFINECPELAFIPEGGFPDNLIVLCITSCLKLTPRIEWGLRKLHNLSSFEIEGGCGGLESFPKQKLLPNNLNSLRISRLPNLRFLDYEGLQHLTSLETLQINYCSKLGSLPEEGLPSSLTSLYISGCSLLKTKLQNKKGIHWYNIAHIPYIQIDEEVIS